MENGELALDVVTASKLKSAFKRGKWNNADIEQLASGDMAERILPTIRGAKAGVPSAVPVTANKSRFGRVEVKHIIDLDADPFVPNGWSYNKKDQLPKRACGEFVWNPKKSRLHLSPKQKGGKWIKGDDLKTELEEHTVFGANVLDYLLEHQELIPNSWKGQAIFFWGTIYRLADGDLVVRYLYWIDGRWISDVRGLGSGWNETNPALVRAS